MKLVVNVIQDALMAHIEEYPQRMAESVVRAMNRVTIMIQTRVKEKLSGEVLHVQTGTLRRSINREVRVGGPGLIEGVVGTNVEYGRVHEYGFKGTVMVRAHVRELRERGRMKLFKKPGKEFGVWVKERGRLTGKIAIVGLGSGYADRSGNSYFPRQVNMPERSFLRSTLKEFEEKATEELQYAAWEALEPR